MVAQVSKSGLLAKLEKRAIAVHDEVKTSQLNYGNPTLPAGIEGGIAQLVLIKFGEYEEGKNKGEVYFMAQGVVKFPDEHNGISVKGLRTQIGPEPLCDTPTVSGKRKTFKDHYQWVLNQIRILGYEDMTDVKFSDLERVVADLLNRKPYFKFRTWQGQKQEIKQQGDKWVVCQGGRVIKGPFESKEQAQKQAPYADKEPMVTHEWNGWCRFSEDPEAHLTNGVADHTAAVPDQLEHHEASSEGTEVVAEPNNQTFNEFDDLDSLADQAASDPGAGARLTEMAVKCGVTATEIEEAASWQEVVKMITQKKEKPAAKKTAAAFIPKKGNTCRYASKPGGKETDCEILAVDTEKKTVNLKDLTTNALYKGVLWASLKAS